MNDTTKQIGKTAKDGPRSYRLGPEHEQIIEKIIKTYSAPGYVLNYNAAVKIALAFWKETQERIAMLAEDATAKQSEAKLDGRELDAAYQGGILYALDRILERG